MHEAAATSSVAAAGRLLCEVEQGSLLWHLSTVVLCVCRAATGDTLGLLWGTEVGGQEDVRGLPPAPGP